jgi:gluconolactonase
MTPKVIETEVFAELPARLRKSGTPPERLAAGKSATPAGSFLEGPAFDRQGNLYVVDLAWGRIFRIDAKGAFELVIEYDGEPNGLAIHKDGRIFVADHKHGILFLDNAKTVPVVSRYHQQSFKGVNDLTFDLEGNLYFTDQGVSDLADPSGCVYRYANGKLTQIANRIPSPNGLVFYENLLYVAATRANAVWRLPIAPDGTIVRMGIYLQLSGGRRGRTLFSHL